jgi:hypothetical protein
MMNRSKVDCNKKNKIEKRYLLRQDKNKLGDI